MAHRWLVVGIAAALLAALAPVADAAPPTAPAPSQVAPAPATPPRPAQATPPTDPDRRWIIKGQSPGSAAPPAAPPKEPAWKDPAQKELCSRRLDELEDAFQKAQHYSIQGDACVTAREAARFLDLVERCRKECPAEFLEANGLKPELIRNISVLKRLGEERCPQR